MLDSLGMNWRSVIAAVLWHSAVWSSLHAAEVDIRTQVPEVVPALVAGTAVTKPSDLQAEFSKAPLPEWVWGPNPDTTYYLRTEFEGSDVATALLRASCDNSGTVSINGKQVLSNDNWQVADSADVTAVIKPGKNVLVAKVANQGGSSGFLLKLVMKTTAGGSKTVISRGDWQASAKEDFAELVPIKVHGPLGMKPWGNPFEETDDATAGRNQFNLRPGFQVERLFTVPKDQLGSWVCITFDPKGRLIASDQGDKGLVRITPPPIGSSEPTKVEPIPAKISGAQGLLWAFDSLYVVVNGGPGGNGLYRVRDTDGDDQLDEVVKLKSINGGGEHGPHALRLSPDGKSIIVVAGNHTRPPFEPERNADPQTMGGPRAEQLRTVKLPEGATSRIPTNWDEDLLLPRQWDAGGHAVGVLAPGGWIARTDPEGKAWELLSVGYRNEYDAAFNADGELFAYDADMEWDFGMPWYRPTRVVHATSGSEFGWRSGTGKWPAYYADSLPELVNIGPGSPVGVDFGYGTKFPAKYQKALFICDWTFGTMYAIHITPEGASYRATKEEFVSRSPLPLTDVASGPDGALYFTVGGRGTQSELFRVTYIGPEPTTPVNAKDTQFADERAIRRKLEQFHTPTADARQAIATAWPYLSHPDRHLRYAARIALEQQSPTLWQDRVFAEQDTTALITGAIALARQGTSDVQPKLFAALDRISWATLSEPRQLELLRAYQLALIRLGTPDPETTARLNAKFGPAFPSTSGDFVNRELCNLLVALKSPQIIEKTLDQLTLPTRRSTEELADLIARNKGYGRAIADMLANQPDAQKIHYLFALRNLKSGWTLPQRKAYFDGLKAARAWSGGASYQGFLRNIDREAFENATEAERLAIEAYGARTPFKATELPQPAGPGRDWTLENVLALAGDKPLTGRDFKNGQKTFAATRCVVCHRFAGDGGATGPDLTQVAGRFSYKDLCEAILDPSKVVSDQYRATTIQTASGKSYTGRVVSENESGVTMVVDPEDPTKVVTIKPSEIDERVVSTTSLMPKDLLKPLNENEVLDLLAYVLSRGNPSDAMFRKSK